MVSDRLPVLSGVRQGSVVGPSLFLKNPVIFLYTLYKTTLRTKENAKKILGLLSVVTSVGHLTQTI